MVGGLGHREPGGQLSVGSGQVHGGEIATTQHQVEDGVGRRTGQERQPEPWRFQRQRLEGPPSGLPVTPWLGGVM